MDSGIVFALVLGVLFLGGMVWLANQTTRV